MSREWERSSVMSEFMKIAAKSGLITTNLKPEDKDFVGNPSKETPVKDHRRYEPTEEYDVTKGEDLVQEAHPETAQVADALGNGAVVENLNEQQEKSIDVATKMPNGALVGVHANLINNLVKIADQLDKNGKSKEAAKVDKVIERLVRLPFADSPLRKKAAWSLVLFTVVSAFAPAVINWFRSKKFGKEKGQLKPGRKPVGKGGRVASLVATGIGVLGLLGRRITSLQEGIKEDSQDLLDVLKKAEGGSAKKVLQTFAPLAKSLLQANLSTEQGIKEFATAVAKMNAALPIMEKHIATYTKLEEPSMLGYSLSSRVDAKFDDFKTSLQEAAKTIAQLTSVGAKANASAIADLGSGAAVTGDNNVQFLQQVLYHRGFPQGKIWRGSVTGVMDKNTINSTIELEKRLDEMLKPFLSREGIMGSFQGQIVKDKQVVMEAQQLHRIIMLTEKYLASKTK